MKTRVIPAFVLFVALFFAGLLPDQVQAFDDQRQGFVLGLGGGFGSATISNDNDSESYGGVATTLKIGGGVTNQLLVYYSNRVVFFSENGEQFAQGMSALGFSYFVNPEGPSAFFSGEVGMGVFAWLEDVGGNESGMGITVGAGFAMTPHFLLEANYMTASIGDSDFDWTISNFTVAASWLGF